jgi:putative peptidoglycan lipid II flippase
MLWWRLHQSRAYIPQAGWGRFLLQVTIASALMAVALYSAVPSPPNWFGWTYTLRGLWLVALVAGGSLIYFLVLWLAGIRVAQFRGHH